VLIACGLLLVYPAPMADLIGLTGFAAVMAVQYLRRPKTAPS